MKVILIHKPDDRATTAFKDLTIDKVYDVDLYTWHFKICGDSGNMIALSHAFLNTEFMNIEAYRDNKLNQLMLNDTK